MQDSPSEAELDSRSQRVSKLRQQRFVSQSPLMSPPPAPGGPPKPPRSGYSLTDNRKLGDGGAASDGEIERVGGNTNNLGRKQPKRRESHSRRHTLQNGIDYGLVRIVLLKTLSNYEFQLKKMKAIEEERDGLMRGMQMVARAEEWYQEQLANVQDRMRNLGKMGGGQDNPGSTEAARERLLFQNARSVFDCRENDFSLTISLQDTRS